MIPFSEAWKSVLRRKCYIFLSHERVMVQEKVEAASVDYRRYFYCLKNLVYVEL